MSLLRAEGSGEQEESRNVEAHQLLSPFLPVQSRRSLSFSVRPHSFSHFDPYLLVAELSVLMSLQPSTPTKPASLLDSSSPSSVFELNLPPSSSLLPLVKPPSLPSPSKSSTKSSPTSTSPFVEPQGELSSTRSDGATVDDERSRSTNTAVGSIVLPGEAAVRWERRTGTYTSFPTGTLGGGWTSRERSPTNLCPT